MLAADQRRLRLPAVHVPAAEEVRGARAVRPRRYGHPAQPGKRGDHQRKPVVERLAAAVVDQPEPVEHGPLVRQHELRELVRADPRGLLRLAPGEQVAAPHAARRRSPGRAARPWPRCRPSRVRSIGPLLRPSRPSRSRKSSSRELLVAQERHQLVHEPRRVVQIEQERLEPAQHDQLPGQAAPDRAHSRGPHREDVAEQLLVEREPGRACRAVDGEQRGTQACEVGGRLQGRVPSQAARLGANGGVRHAPARRVDERRHGPVRAQGMVVGDGAVAEKQLPEPALDLARVRVGAAQLRVGHEVRPAVLRIEQYHRPFR